MNDPSEDQKSEVWTVGRLLEWTTPFFKERGIDQPRLDAELLLAHATGLSRLTLYTGYDRPLEPEELSKFRGLVQRRARREPVAYILGRKGFHELMLKVDRRALIPRPETELLVEKALAALRPLPAPRFLDIGTGSGAIAIALLHALPDATAVATDVSEAALALAEENARAYGLLDRLVLRQGAFFAPVPGERFDAVVSNPPYVETAAVLAPEITDFEPHTALFAGEDGLLVLNALLRDAKAHLLGSLFLEHGQGQGEQLCAFAKSHGYEPVIQHHDVNGIDRVLEAHAVRSIG